VGFVVCCGYFQSLNEEWVLLFVVVISRQNPLFVQALDITKTNNKTHSLFRLWI
jgi:hypothetical protein